MASSKHRIMRLGSDEDCLKKCVEHIVFAVLLGILVYRNCLDAIFRQKKSCNE